MTFSALKNYINHYVETIKVATKISGYRLNIILNEIVDNISILSGSLGTVPLQYKALISQNTPVVTTTDPTMVAGQIWTLEAYNAADAATIAALELISGTLYAVGSKYRSAIDQILNVNIATTLSYDGAPYIVSTDANGNFNPFVNTLGGNPVFSYIGVGQYTLTLPATFPNSKTSPQIGSDGNSSVQYIGRNSDNEIYIQTVDSVFVFQDSGLIYTLISIDIYP